MALIRTITGLDLKEAMKEVDRDYYSIDSCNYIVQYYEEFDNVELDPIAIACEWCEESLDYVLSQYGHLEEFEGLTHNSKFTDILDALNYYTYATTTWDENDNMMFLYIGF